MKIPFKVFMFGAALMLLFSLLPSGVVNQGVNVAFASDLAGYQVDMTHNFVNASIGRICQEPKAPAPNCPRVIEDPCANFGPSQMDERINSTETAKRLDQPRRYRRAYTSYKSDPVIFVGVGYSSASVSPETSGNRIESKPATIGRDNNVEPKTCQSPNRD